MMPGTKRKLRLLTDWNVQLLFGRDASELGRLGHPAALGEATAGGTPAEAVADPGEGAAPAAERPATAPAPGG